MTTSLNQQTQHKHTLVHRLRRDSEAVIVGVETVVRDDPSLTVRTRTHGV